MAILDLNEASEFLGADPQDVRYWASHGQLPARNIGGEWYFSDINPYTISPDLRRTRQQ